MFEFSYLQQRLRDVIYDTFSIAHLILYSSKTKCRYDVETLESIAGRSLVSSPIVKKVI